jgi:membrane-anchored protein YejM (alkaline phosphatase superfamily)
VLVLIESLRSDFLSDSVMPRLWQRAQDGTRFTHHYASASSTHFTLFSVIYGRNAQQLETVVGAGTSPLLFGAFRANGYHMRFITSSSVDWMGLKQTVFKDVAGDLDTDIPGAGVARDSAMIARATDWVARADSQPVLLVLFFDGTHFNYSYSPASHRFTPDWDGAGSITAARVDPILMKRRAMNAAVEVDTRLGNFLDWFAARRGRRPLTVVTGDHGEAFREHGRVGHGAGVAEEEIHVPMVLVDDGVPAKVETGVTSHVDIVPTIFHLLGDRHAPTWSDGALMTDPPSGRFVVSTAGWIPRYAVVGERLKAQFFGLDAGLGSVTLTGPADEPLPDANAELRANAPAILRALRR